MIQRREKADKFAEIVRGMGRDSSVEDKVFGNDAADEDKSRESGIRSLLNRRRLRFTTLRDKISDKNQTSFVIVLAAERLPVLETIELQQQLKKAKISVDCLVVNKRSPDGRGRISRRASCSGRSTHGHFDQGSAEDSTTGYFSFGPRYRWCRCLAGHGRAHCTVVEFYVVDPNKLQSLRAISRIHLTWMENKLLTLSKNIL